MIGLNPLQARLLMPVRRVAHSSSRGLARRAMSGGAAAGTATSGPSTAASAVMLSIPVLTFGLGTWQIARKKQKEELIAHMNAKLVQAAKPLPTRLDRSVRGAGVCTAAIGWQDDMQRRQVHDRGCSKAGN